MKQDVGKFVFLVGIYCKRSFRMNAKYFVMCVALAFPLSSYSKDGADTNAAWARMLKENHISTQVTQTKHNKSDEAVTALELFFGLKTKAFLPGKPEQRQRLIEVKAKRQGYVKSSRSGVAIDKEMIFRTGSAELNNRTKKRLETIAKLYKRHTREIKSIIIEGHTNDIGTRQNNMKLSNKRANSVRRELVRQGVPSWVIKATGYGEYHLLPKVAPSSPLNRRVEYSIVKR